MSYIVLFFAGYVVGTMGFSTLIPTFILVTGLTYSCLKNIFYTKNTEPIKAIEYREVPLSNKTL